MTLATDLAKQIEAYIGSSPECKTNRIQVLEIAGKRCDLEVYRLLIDMLRYNIRNGRFAAEYKELRSKIGRDLDPNDEKDANQIKKLLLEQDKNATKVLRDDLVRVGQRNPGVITYDGFVINGNRRMAVFKQLLEETGENKWRYLEVSKLPKGTGEQDVWRIEAGLQFSREERLDYGPVNRLLKFREGISAGLTTKQIAATLYGGFTPENIEEDLERLKLIESYLDFVEKPGHFKTAEGLNEHFIDLRNFIQREKKRGTNDLEIMKVTKFAFDLIRNGISHWDLRDINKIMKEDASKKSLLTEIEKNPEISAVVKPKPKKIISGEAPNEEGLPKPKGKEAATMQTFYDSVDVANAAEESNKPTLLLKRALTNLKGIEPASLMVHDPTVKALLEELDKILQKIKKATPK
jgi:hypothetical protein